MPFFIIYVLCGLAITYSIMMLEFLPTKIKNSLNQINSKYLYEIRLRAEKPIMVNYMGKYSYLGEHGLSERIERSIVIGASEIEDCVFKAGKYSVYSIEEQLKSGFLTAQGGVRLGLAGEFVFKSGQVVALRNISSICIRIPHEIIDCGKEIYEKCMRDKVHNTLIMSSPGLGKTTILRDIGRILGEKTRKNLLICDERGEISAGKTGDMSDIIKFSDKNFAFEVGVRTMRPDVIITDELSEKDCIAIKKAVIAGISVVASAHFSDIKYVKSPFIDLFERYVLLDETHLGKIAAIYGEGGRLLEC